MDETTFLFEELKSLGFNRLILPGGKLSKNQAYHVVGLDIMFDVEENSFSLEVMGVVGYYKKYVSDYASCDQVFEDIQYRVDLMLMYPVEESDWYKEKRGLSGPFLLFATKAKTEKRKLS